jgi:hypothetical protein
LIDTTYRARDVLYLPSLGDILTSLFLGCNLLLDEMITPKNQPLTVRATQDLFAFLQFDKGLRWNADVTASAYTFFNSDNDRVTQPGADKLIPAENGLGNIFGCFLSVRLKLLKTVLRFLELDFHVLTQFLDFFFQSLDC